MSLTNIIDISFERREILGLLERNPEANLGDISQGFYKYSNGFKVLVPESWKLEAEKMLKEVK